MRLARGNHSHFPPAASDDRFTKVKISGFIVTIAESRPLCVAGGSWKPDAPPCASIRDVRMRCLRMCVVLRGSEYPCVRLRSGVGALLTNPQAQRTGWTFGLPSSGVQAAFGGAHRPIRNVSVSPLRLGALQSSRTRRRRYPRCGEHTAVFTALEEVLPKRIPSRTSGHTGLTPDHRGSASPGPAASATASSAGTERLALSLTRVSSACFEPSHSSGPGRSLCLSRSSSDEDGRSGQTRA